MRGMRMALGLVAVLMAGELAAESILEFDLRMQKIDRVSQSLMKHLDNKDADAAGAGGQEMATLYQEMEDYFIQRGNSDSAVKISREGRELAVEVVKFAARQDFDAAFNATKGITRECRACHVVYDPL